MKARSLIRPLALAAFAACSSGGSSTDPGLPLDLGTADKGDAVHDGLKEADLGPGLIPCSADPDCWNREPGSDLCGLRCSGGMCKVVDDPTGLPCDDHDSCTGDDRCTAEGWCRGEPDESAGGCGSCSDDEDCDKMSLKGSCVARLSCDKATGRCTRTAEAADRWCNDVVHAVEKGACFRYVCDAVLDQCVLDTTLFAEQPFSKCDDGYSCTKGDTCSNGRCTGMVDECVKCGKGVTGQCREEDPCRIDASCADGACQWTDKDSICRDPVSKTGDCLWKDSTGACVAPVADGDQCNVAECFQGKCRKTPLAGKTCTNPDDKCFVTGVCTKFGACKGTKPRDCSTLDDECHAGACDAATGQCTQAPRPDGWKCDPGDPCVQDAACKAGKCEGVPKECPGDPCNIGLCVAGIGTCAIQARSEGEPCNDGDPCTLDDHCEAGKCVHSSAKPDCDDGNLCTADWCEPGKGCSHTPAAGVACDDGDPCTVPDMCLGGKCTSGPDKDCTDKVGDYAGLPKKCDPICTDDSCDPGTGNCIHVPNVVKCDDANPNTKNDHCFQCLCVGEIKACDDGNPCTDDVSDPVKGCIYTNNSGPCDDGDACTAGDHCAGGGCIPGAEKQCDDGNPCTKDSCDKTGGVCIHDGKALNYQPCDDGDQCTQPDKCLNGNCQGMGGKICNDGNQCTKDYCDVALECVYDVKAMNGQDCSDANACTAGDKCQGGVCIGGPPPDCDDGNPCTDDKCEPLKGCYHTNNTDNCDDGDACTTIDKCVSGKCIGGPPPVCDDGNPCTDNKCAPDKGCTYSNNTAKCDDGNACTLTDLCKDGTCSGSQAPDCNDKNPCTDDTCTPLMGCLHLNNTLPCDDGNACTIGEKCGNGLCLGGATVICDDKNPCTGDSCDPEKGCQYDASKAEGNPCTDGDPCTTGDKCASGLCKGTGGMDCNDGNPCTDDACDPIKGCSHAFNVSACDDDNACTSGDKCKNGLCQGIPVNCNDGNLCTDDSCDVVTGCTHANNSVLCNDGNACTTNDTCKDGKCVGQGLSCDDGNPCTDDNCNELGTGCTHAKKNSGACTDYNACTENDTCSNGNCVGFPKSCDDGIACTNDSCNPATGCMHNADNSKCPSDGIACTSEVCVAGIGCKSANTCGQPNPTCLPTGTCACAADLVCDQATATACAAGACVCGTAPACTPPQTCVGGACQ